MRSWRQRQRLYCVWTEAKVLQVGVVPPDSFLRESRCDAALFCSSLFLLCLAKEPPALLSGCLRTWILHLFQPQNTDIIYEGNHHQQWSEACLPTPSRWPPTVFLCLKLRLVASKLQRGFNQHISIPPICCNVQIYVIASLVFNDLCKMYIFSSSPAVPWCGMRRLSLPPPPPPRLPLCVRLMRLSGWMRQGRWLASSQSHLDKSLSVKSRVITLI